MRFDRHASSVQDHDDRAVDDAVITLVPESGAPAAAREFLSAHRDDLPDDLIDDALLLVTELVSNAVRHGHSGIVLRVRAAPPGIGVAVADAGTSLPPRPGEIGLPGADAVTGRGLAIVDAVASEWGVTAHDPAPGKTVWFELRREQARDGTDG